jgi:hypothetical protein
MLFMEVDYIREFAAAGKKSGHGYTLSYGHG